MKQPRSIVETATAAALLMLLASCGAQDDPGLESSATGAGAGGVGTAGLGGAGAAGTEGTSGTTAAGTGASGVGGAGGGEQPSTRPYYMEKILMLDQL
jgi:hypothetical protein